MGDPWWSNVFWWPLEDYEGNTADQSFVLETTPDCYIIGQPRYYDENMNPGPPITPANYAAWVAVGKPDCWCCPHHGYGDVDGNGWINFNDMVTIGYYVGDPAGSINCTRADVDHNGFTNFNDFTEVQPKIGVVPQLPNTCADCATKCPLEP